VGAGGWTGHTIVSFSTSNVGAYPQAGVVWNNGALYGTTASDINGGCGAVYAAVPPVAKGEAWTGTAIHNFGGPDGCGSDAPLIVGPNGVLYGTTYYGGSGGPICVYPVDAL
jgi:hypothetical protein